MVAATFGQSPALCGTLRGGGAGGTGCTPTSRGTGKLGRSCPSLPPWNRAVSHGELERGSSPVSNEISRGRDEGVEELARLAKVVLASGAALRCRGLVDDDVESLLRAVSTYRRGPYVLQLAFAIEDAALALTKIGQTEENPAARRGTGNLREPVRHSGNGTRRRPHPKMGLRRGRRGPRGRPKSGSSALTETERRVAALVSEGFTNSEIGRQMFVSPRTVQTHVSHIFAKLGVTSPVQLATEATRQRRHQLDTESKTPSVLSR